VIEPSKREAINLKLRGASKTIQEAMPFGEILEAADKLSVNDQEALRDILSKRIIDRRREELYEEIRESQEEYKAGTGKAGEPDEIIDEILS
jgi:ribonuclease HII